MKKMSLMWLGPVLAALFSLPAHAQGADPGAAAVAKAAKEPGAVVTASGLVYRSLKEGSGASPSATDTVKVHYRGTLPDGKEFDSSYSRGQPAEFPLNRVIPCWTEGVQKMKVGGKAKLTCPPAIAYGAKGAPGAIAPNATLHFEVELLASPAVDFAARWSFVADGGADAPAAADEKKRPVRRLEGSRGPLR